MTPGQSVEGLAIFNFPITKEQWDTLQTAKVVVSFMHQKNLELLLPSAVAASTLSKNISIERSAEASDRLHCSLRSPGFPVKLVGAGELHAAFLTESSTRGNIRCSVAGNPGPVGMTKGKGALPVSGRVVAEETADPSTSVGMTKERAVPLHLCFEC